MENLKDTLEFPVIFTFKIVGDDTPGFEAGVKEIFEYYSEKSINTLNSRFKKYISYSVTVEIRHFEELRSVYEKIAAVRGLRFYV